MDKGKDITYIGFEQWNKKVVKTGFVAVIIIFIIQFFLGVMFKPDTQCNKAEYFKIFVVIPTILHLIVVIYLYLVSKFLTKILNQYMVSVLMIIGEVTFVTIALAVHTSIPFMCLALIHPIMFTSIYKDRIFCWITCGISVLAYTLVVFEIVPTVKYIPPSSPFIYFVVFATLIVLSTMWTLAVKDYHVEFDKSVNRLKKEADFMKNIAEKDSLTGLYNHNVFYDKLNFELSSIEKLQNFTPIEYKNLHLIVIDIDNFKKVNDTYGHVAGDRVIVSVSEQIKKCMNNNSFAARYGGEEFVVVYKAIGRKQAIQQAERIRELCMNDSVVYEKEDKSKDEIRYTISIGVSSYDEDIDTGYQLFMKADSALYKAKKTGKNKVVY